MANIQAIVVAAGSASRMGEIKQLLPWKKTTLLGNAIEQILKTEISSVLTVLGSNYDLIKTEIKNLETEVIHHKNWREGIGTSIACGINHIVEKKNAEAILIMLADQPLLDSKYLEKLIANYVSNPSKITATRYTNNIGVPAIFPAKYFEALSKLKGDSGAKNILNDPSIEVLVLDPEDKILDIDTPEDYKILKARNS